MAKNDANPPMPAFSGDYVLQEVDDRLPVQGGQAQAVPPHRPVRVHHVRGLRRHLPVEVHPHAVHRHHRRGRSNTDRPGEDPDDHVVFIVDEDVCTRCGLCVDRCPTGVIIMGKAGVAAQGRRRPPARRQARLRLRDAVLRPERHVRVARDPAL